MNSGHKWTDADCDVAVRCYFNEIGLRDASKRVGVTEGVMRSRCSEVKYLDTGTGYSHPAQSTVEAYNRYKSKKATI